jgi:hypothetical protein
MATTGVPGSAGTPTVNASGGAPSRAQTAGAAPAIAWLGLLFALVAIRVLYELGGDVG